MGYRTDRKMYYFTLLCIYLGYVEEEKLYNSDNKQIKQDNYTVSVCVYGEEAY